MGVFGAAVAVPAVRAYWVEARALTPPLSDEIADVAARGALLQGSNVSFRLEELDVAGWFLPGSNGAGVVLVHGTGSERSSLIAEMELLNDAGFAVLSFDQPGHGQSEGRVRFDGVNRRTIGVAVDWLMQQSSVDDDRVGALGLSYGGYDLIHAAVDLERLRAIAVAGAPGDINAQSRWEYPGALSYWGASVAMKQVGLPLDEPSASDLVASLAPRPLLVIWGAQDGVVPRDIAEAVFFRAEEPKTWVELPHSGHGGYATSDPVAYRTTLVRFFEQALAQR